MVNIYTLSFADAHLVVGEKFIEFVGKKCGDEDCFCLDFKWTGPPCDRVPEPFPDHEADEDHYLHWSKVPSLEEYPRSIDQFQPRKHCRLLYTEGKVRQEKIMLI